MAKKKSKSSAKKKQSTITRGKRKESVARATVFKGSGVFRVNRFKAENVFPPLIFDLVREPLLLAGNAASKVDVYVSVNGGGIMSQAQAVRTAVARGLVDFLKDSSLEQKFKEQDPHLIKEDVRRVEPKKYLGPKARARRQKSYR